MTETKPWYKSLGEWAAIVIPIFGIILPIFGKVELAKLINEEQAGIVEWLTALGVLISSALAFYGRYRATKRIE